jgi:enamine deaminase RidA (YjgF/YER057c/UK114 family)
VKLTHINPADVYDSLHSRGYTQVVKVQQMSELIVLAGHMPLDEKNALLGPGDIELQTRAVYDNLRRSLRAAGADLHNIVRMTTYLIDLAGHTAAVRRVRAEYFGTTIPPASTMIEIPRLPGGILIEVEALAVL